MTAPRQPTLTAAIGGRPSGRPLQERLLGSFAQIEAGEGRSLALFFAYAFLVLVSLYIVRTLREPLLLVDASAEVKTYASAAAALALLVLVPLYGAAFRRTNRNQLVRGVTGFFIATLGALFLARRNGIDIGFAYYVWAGVFGVTIVAQFWAHAADCFDVETGRRLFPTIMMGATLGGIVGPSVYRALNDSFDASQLMLVAIALLALTVPLVSWTRRSVPIAARCRGGEPSERAADSAFGGFALVARDRYLLLIALLIMLLNCVSTLGDFLLADIVVRHSEEQLASNPSLDKGQIIGDFYASFYLSVNVLTVVLQMFLVGRLLRWVGVGGALLVLPLIALLGYGLFAFLPIFAVLRVVRIGEYAGNYSVFNTARQALFLPLSTKGKYEGKITTDTFFWRFGDLIPAVIVFIGLHWLDFTAQQFAVVNMGLSLVWLAIAVQLARRSPEGPSERVGPSFVRRAAAIAFVRSFATAGLATRAASWLAAAVGVAALASSAPADAASDGHAAAKGLFDEVQPFEMDLVFDWQALCRNPRKEKCADLPATLVYRDALDQQQHVSVALRTRGRYRADTVRCALPALFVYFTGDTRDTLFAGETMLPLTTHCSRADEYEQYLLKEYLGYRIYGVLSTNSLRVRLAHVTYRDSAGRLEPFERYAFFTEHFDSFARRHGVAVRSKQQLFDPRTSDPQEMATFDLFQYAIGNTDWSAVKGHNVLIVESDAGRATAVPFDFDFSGLVDAGYATVAPELSIRSVRQRVFRGLCDPETDWEAAFAHFAALREHVLALADEVPGLEPKERDHAVEYLDGAFATFASERRQSLIIDMCRRGAVR